MADKSRNIHQVINFAQLKRIVGSNMTVIVGFVCSDTSKADRAMIRKFLKSKSKDFPLIQFVFMDLTDEQIRQTKLGLVSKNYDDYPIVYHIRDGNQIGCKVNGATVEKVYESFGNVQHYYQKEMEIYEQARLQKIGASSDNISSDSVIEDVKNTSHNIISNDIDVEPKTEYISESKSKSNKQNETELHNNQNDNTNNMKIDTEIKLTTEQTAASIKAQHAQIEISFAKAQNELMIEIRDRIKLERKLAKEIEKREKEVSSKEKLEKHNSSSHRRLASNIQTQHDRIGNSTNDKRSQQNNHGRSNKRR